MAMDSPYVSVIIPNYNHSRYLDQRIQSVLTQTYNNFELIILDDNSTDNSVDVINKYRNNPRITNIVINEKNSGSTFIQWNKGFQLAKGEIIWIAESDDFCEPDFLERLIDAYNAHPDSVVVYSGSQYVDSEGNYLYTDNDNGPAIHYFEGKEFIERKLAYGCAIWNASSAVFSKNVANTLNQQYQKYKACGDRLFWIEMAERGNVVYVNKKLNYFRQHLNKVSPKRFMDGTSLKEEYKINKYLCSHRYLSGMRRVFVLSLYYKKIQEGDFLNLGIKKELLELWGFTNRLRIVMINVISRLYIYYSLYILRQKPL